MFIDCPYVNCEGTGMGFKCNQNLMSCDRCTIAHPELIKKEEPTKKKVGSRNYLVDRILVQWSFWR